MLRLPIPREKTPEYICWDNMMQRCYNTNNAGFKNYGDRGITVCERWHIFDNFFADVGERPTFKHTLERKDNDGNYEPSNCVWETRTKQARNRRTNKLTISEAREIRMLYIRGYTQTELAIEFGVSQYMVWGILKGKYWKESNE